LGSLTVSTFRHGPIKFNKKKVRLVRGKGRAKNGDELFWEEKFPVANGKARAHAKGALHSSVWGVGDLEKDIFQFSLVPFKFPISYCHVFNLLPKFSMYSPNMFSIAPHL
jgi:hypothetical protein